TLMPSDLKNRHLKSSDLIERSDEIKQAEETNDGGSAPKKDVCRGIRRYPLARMLRQGANQTRQSEKGKHYALVSKLDPSAKCEDSQRHRGARQFSHYREKSASEAESMKKTEEKSHAQAGSPAA